MLRKTFEHEIQQVKDDVLLLGSMVEQAILGSVEALKKRDIKAAERLFEQDREINAKRFEIEHKLMILIATQQPMAHDLRLLASCMEIISELERMGDYAKGISNINIRMVRATELKPKTLGNIHWDTPAKKAEIKVLSLADYRLPYADTLRDMEFTVVHELIHLQLSSLPRSEASRGAEERAVNQITEALLDLARQ